MTDLILSRSQAKSADSAIYFTGRPCRNGHLARRFVVNGCCTQCLKVSNRKAYQADIDKARDRSKQYGAKNARARSQRAKTWAKMNAGKVNARTSARKALLIKRMPPWLSDDDKSQIAFTYMLTKAWSDATRIQHHVDHIIPLRGTEVSGLHVPWNLRIVTAIENLTKSNRLDQSITLM